MPPVTIDEIQNHATNLFRESPLIIEGHANGNMNMRELDFRANLFTVYGLTTHAPPITVRVTLVPGDGDMEWEASPHVSRFSSFNIAAVDEACDDIGEFLRRELQVMRELYGPNAAVKVQLRIV